MIRLDKFLADMGFGTRTEVKKMVRKGLCCVSDETEKDAGRKIDPQTDTVTVEGQVIEYKPFVYLMMNKPPGVICATEDSRNETVLDLLPVHFAHYDIHPVGRLDKDTVGLLLLSNDGVLTHRLLSPKHKVPKVYFARLAKPLDQDAQEKLEQGVTLDDGYVCMSAVCEMAEDGILLTIVEGKYHQVKRMLVAVGNEVTFLKRVRFAGLALDQALQPGQCRELSEDELGILWGE